MSALGRKHEHQEPRRPYQAPRNVVSGLIFATLPSVLLWLLAGAGAVSLIDYTLPHLGFGRALMGMLAGIGEGVLR